MPALTKTYPVFDCDAHVTESPEIWNYLSANEKEHVKDWFWPVGTQVLINGNTPAPATWGWGRAADLIARFREARRFPHVLEVSGPGVNKKVLRKFYHMALTEEQYDYIEHPGAREPNARVKDMDLMGIDQVVVIPLMMFSAFSFVENHHAAALMTRAYNDWVYDWCSVHPDRLFPAAVLPTINPYFAALELQRVAKKGSKVALVRPVDAQRNYPNKPGHEVMWRTFEETKLVVGMHSLVTGGGLLNNKDGTQYTPGNYVDRVVSNTQLLGPSQTLSFIHEAMTWLANVLASGFLGKHPGITRMAIMESNAGWLPVVLEQADRVF